MDRPSHPLTGEVVRPARGRDPSAELAPLVLALVPVLARLGWWWWTRRQSTPPPDPPAPAEVERTEVEMTRRPLGATHVRVVRIRWLAPQAPVARGGPVARTPLGLGLPLRLASLLLGVRRRRRPGLQTSGPGLALPAPVRRLESGQRS